MDVRGVAVGLLFVVLIAIFGITISNSHADETSYEYLDIVPLSDFGDVKTVSGAAEIVTFGGSPYIKFNNVGKAVIITADGAQHYTIKPAHMQLVMLSGQSNAVYFAAAQNLLPTDPAIQPGRIFYFGINQPDPAASALATQNNYADCGIMDLASADLTSRVANMYPVMAADLIKETTDKILIVNTAIGGRAIMWWNDGALCDEYGINVMNSVKESAEGKVILEPIAVLWSQGESDVTRSEEYYTSKFIPLVEKFRTGYYGGYEFPIVICSLPKQTNNVDGQLTNPAKAQIAAAAEYDYIFVSSSLAYHLTAEQMRTDGAHYKQMTYGWFGEAFARQLSICYEWRTVAQTVVLLNGEAAEGDPSIGGYGTSGDEYTCSIIWEETIGEVMPPAGMAIRPEIAVVQAAEPEPEPEPEEP